MAAKKVTTKRCPDGKRHKFTKLEAYVRTGPTETWTYGCQHCPATETTTKKLRKR